jgi:alkylhydroperoxidase family enzyme
MATTHTTLTIRRLGESDAREVRRLEALDTGPMLEGPMLGAEVEGRLLAAVSIDTGEVVADPFSRTAELRSLLELRAGQLRGRSANAARHAGRIRRPGRRHSRGSLAGSPPGAGGKLLSLYSPAS